MTQRLFSHLTQLTAACVLVSTFLARSSAESNPIATATKTAAPGVRIVQPVDRLNAGSSPQIESYGELAYRTYREAYTTALALARAVDHLIAQPDDAALAAAQKAWLASRPSYGQSEAFRFYGGPIDAGKRDDFGLAPVGIEGLLNAWPLNEAYIDYVEGNPAAGVIQSRVPITRALLVSKNARDDEADVTTGYHAIEFLLWGQDASTDGPGDRRVKDFVGDGPAERRRTYLKLATDLLVENLKTLLDAWAPGQDNYRALLRKMTPATGIRNMLTGIATLSGFELASERLATALDSGSQEDEQSCFSDSTHVDILANAIGVENVYFGRFGSWRGAGINQLVQKANPDLNRYLEQRIRASVALARQLDRPFDRSLATPPGSPSRAKLEALVKALQLQADLLKQAASALGVPIVIGDND
jgi:putative iron-regulated protein